MSFDDVMSLPRILNQSDSHWYGMIGKKHVGPSNVYPFPFSYTELDGYDLNLVGRNITFMNEKMQEFLKLAQEKKKPFLLYMAFFDVHRCGGNLGGFCELYGDGGEGHGTIPDWKPKTYDPSSVEVPFYIQDTPAARADIAAQYRSVNRMDQGTGLFIKTLADYGFDNNTLIIFTADNGIPFPNAKTNLYEPGMGEPMMVSNPMERARWGMETSTLASTVDIVPTILDWFGMDPPKYKLNGATVNYEGKSLLPVTKADPSPNDPKYNAVFSSHNLHEITMYYPMRVMRTNQYRLIHNLNFKMPYPIASDLFSSPTFQDLLKSTEGNVSTKWFKDLQDYYYRSEWELFDVQDDPQEMKNLASDSSHQDVLQNMKEKLLGWQNVTHDPWLCMPGGEIAAHRSCSSFMNGL